MNLNKEIVIGGVSRKQRLVLVKQLYAGIKAGYPILDALKISLAQASGRMKQVLSNVIERVDNGAYLHESFGQYPKYFPALFLNLIKTGEVSGSLEDNLKRLIDVTSKEIEFRQKVRSAMTYPIFVFVALIGLGISVSTLVLPNLIPLFASIDTELPMSTQILLWFSDLTKEMGLMLWVYMLLIILICIWLYKFKYAKPFFDWLALHVPVFGVLNRKLIMARFSRTMYSLLASGIELERSLEITSSIITNHGYQKIIAKSLPLVRKGEHLSEYLADYSKFFDQMFVSLLSLGEKTGSMEDSFSYLSEFFDNEVDERMKNLAVSLEPILLIIVGLLVGFVAFAIIGPIYSLTGALR